MKDYVNEHLRKTAASAPVRPKMYLADGTTISVQASRGHYCTPREDGLSHYTHVEIGFPADLEPFKEWAEVWEKDYTGVAGWVPVEAVNEYIEKRGGPRI